MNRKIFIIAEMSANHNHKIKNVFPIIKAAKETEAMCALESGLAGRMMATV